MFEEWCKTFDPDEHKGQISELLVNVPEIRALYAKLVGTFISWCCVYFIHADTSEKERFIQRFMANSIQNLHLQ